MPDLFSLAQAQPRNLDRKESAPLVEVLKALRTYPHPSAAQPAVTALQAVRNRIRHLPIPSSAMTPPVTDFWPTCTCCCCAFSCLKVSNSKVALDYGMLQVSK